MFDIVIAGAGSAGCVLAARLSENPRLNVLLIEAGGRDNYPWVHIPIGYLYCIDNPRTDWRYRTEPEAGLGGRSLLYPRGRVLGGSSSINGMLYLRGQSADYDGWRQMGCTGWGWDDVLPLFRKSEDYVDGASEYHGSGGPLRVENQRLRWDILDDFARAAESVGIPATDDFNRGDNEGVGYFKVTQKRGLRMSAARAFLRPARRRPNLTVWTGRQVRRVLIEDRRAIGLELNGPAGIETVRGGQIVLSAGAIGTPQILQLSGIGPGALLQRLGIPVLRDADVGGNLQDHLQIRCAWRLSGARTLNQMSATLLGRMRIGAEYALRRTGPMSMAPSQLGAFARSSEAAATPDLEWHVQPLSLDAFGQPLHRFAAMTASVCHLRPQSRGSVQIASADPMAAPLIAPNYLSTEGDRLIAARAIRRTREIMAAPAMARYHPQELQPGVAAAEINDENPDSDAALAAAAGRIGSTIFHPVGTARMGGDDDAIVDPRLRVRGIEGLRVVDASVMPTITSGNTNAPTMMIAEKAALMMAEEIHRI